MPILRPRCVTHISTIGPSAGRPTEESEEAGRVTGRKSRLAVAPPASLNLTHGYVFVFVQLGGIHTTSTGRNFDALGEFSLKQEP